MPPQAFRFSRFLFAYYAYAGTFGTYATLFFAARGLTVPQIGLLMSMIPVMRIVGPNFWGWVADRSERRARTLRVTAAGALLAFLSFFAADGYFQLFLAMVLLNLFTSAQSPLTEALMLGEMRGDLSSYGKLRMWGSLGFIAAVLIGGYVLEWFGVESLLVFCAVLLLMVLGAALPIREGAATHAAHDKPRLASVIQQPGVLAFFLSVALMCGAHMALYIFYSLYLERAGYSNPVIGAMWSIGVVAEVAFFYFQARFFTRFGARSLMLAALWLGVLRFAVIGAAPNVPWLLVGAQLLHAATFAAHHSASVMVMQRWFAGPLQARGQALYMSVGYGVGCSLGGLALTAVWDSVGPEQMHYAAALMCVGAAAAGWFSFHRQAQSGL